MATKQFLTDADFEDTGPLKPVKTGILGRAGDLGLSALKSAIAVPETAVGLANIVSGGKAGKAVEDAGVRFNDAKQILDDQKSVAGQLAQRRFDEAQGFTGKLGAAVENPSLIANTLVESAAPMLAGGVVGRGISVAAPRLAGYAGAIGEGAIGAGSAAEQIRQESTDGELSGKQAALAGASGLATGLLGYGGSKLAGRLGVGDIDTALAGGARTAGVQAGKEAPGMLKRIGGGALSEGVFEELPQSVSEQMLQNVALDRDPMQGVDAAAAMGILSGGLMGGGMGVVSGQPKQQATPAQPPVAPTTTPGAPPASTPPAGPTLGQSLTGTPMADLMGSGGLSGGANPLQAGLSTLTSNNQMYPGMNTEPTGYTVDPETGAIIPAEPVGVRQMAAPAAQVEAPAPVAQSPAAPAPVAPALGESLTGTSVADMLDTSTPSQRMGLNPALGGLTAAAAIAVDSGASPVTAGMGLRALSGAAPVAQPVADQAAQPQGAIANATQATQTQQAAPQQQGTPAAIVGVQGGANAMPVAEGLETSSAPAVQGSPAPAVQVQQGVASQVTAGSKQSKADNLAALQQKLAGQTKPTPAAEQEKPLPPSLSAKLQEAHRALGRDVTRSQVQRMRDSVAREVETGTTNNGGVISKLTPKAVATRREQLQKLDADLALFDGQQATPAPEAGPTNQGATNGQGQETLLKAEQPTGAAAMVSGAPVAAGNTGNAGGADSGRATKPERQYNLVAINEKTGKKTQLNATPLTHQQAVTMKSKNTEREGRRIQLEQIVQPSDTTKPGGFTEKVRKAAGKVAPAPVAAQQTAAEAQAKKNATQTADATSKPDGVAGDAADRPTTHTKPVEYVAKLNREIPAKAPDEKPTPDTLKAAASIPTFQGWKTKMARAITEKVRQYWGGNASKIDTIIDYFGGSGSWGAYMAGAAFPNVKRLVIHEFNPDRLNKIRLFNDRGGDVEKLLAAPEVKAYFDAVSSAIDKKSTFSGSAIANVVADSNSRLKLRIAARDAVGADVFDGLLQAIQDQGNASYGKYGKGKSGSDAVDDMLRRITSNAGQAYAQMQSLRERGASIEYVTGNSYEAKQTPGKNVLAMVDPPYYATKGYNGVSLVGIDTYNDTRKLLDRLKSAGNSVIYTDEAWWEKHDKNTGRTIVPPDSGKQVDGLDAFGQLSSIKGLMGDFFRMPIATRMEVVGFIDGNRNAGTIGRSSSADARQAQRAGQAGEDAGGLGTGTGQQSGGGMAKGNDRVSEGQPAKPGRLNPSTGAGKADARNAALTLVVRNGGNSTAVLTDIAKNSTNPAFRLVAKAILAKGLPFDLRIRTDFTDGKVAHYSTDGHFVEFDPSMPFNLEQVLLHEAVHAVTSKYVASFGDSTPLGKELAALFKLAEQHAKKTGAKFYGLTNADEFLAEVMTNADFAQWLDTVPVPLQKSALSRFVRAVARFFGIQKADGATAQAMDVFERIMLAQSDLQAEASQKLSTSKDAAAVAQAYGVDTEADGDTVYFGDAEVSLNREDNTYIVANENEFTPDHLAAVAWAENNGFASELAKSQPANLTPVESMLRDAMEATGDMGAAKDMAYEALRRQGVAVKWQEVVDAAKKMGRGTRASKPGMDAGQLPDTITVDGVQRPTTNSNGQLIHSTEQGVRNFWRWFADSNVVDDNGRPLVVYHGTGSDFTEFKVTGTGAATGNTGLYGEGAYFSQSAEYAGKYAVNLGFGDVKNPNIIPAYLSMQNPAFMNLKAGYEADAAQSTKTAKAMLDAALKEGIGEQVASTLRSYIERKQFASFMIDLYIHYGNGTGVTDLMKRAGFDGALMYGDLGKGRTLVEAVAFDPTTVKSATGNSGAFDPKSEDIRFSQTPASPRTPAATIRAAITKAYGNLLDKLEAKGLVTIAQTEREAIEAAAQARADKTGGDVEQIKRSMLASVQMQRVWHGTPHRFDKFSTEFMGKGEGAQAFGWGLYFANERSIAEHYRKKLQGGALGERASQILEDSLSAQGLRDLIPIAWKPQVIDTIKPLAGNGVDAIKARLLQVAGAFERSQADWQRNSAQLVRQLADNTKALAALNSEAAGQLYEVEIPEDGDMLLWDKPLSEQPENVLAALRRGYEEQGGDYPDKSATPKTGREIYNDFRALAGGFESMDQRAASEYLASLGIKGIKYLDGTSRSAGDGSYNYVIFDGADTQIVDVKYSANGNIEGFFDKQTGKSFLVADNLTAASAPGTLMHEVGIHMAADGKLEPLFKRAGTLLKTGTQNEFIQRVKARMARAGETSDEEAAAYIVTEYENNRLSAPVTVGKWIADLTAAVRAWLFSKGVILKADQLTVADIAAVARANARSMARGGPNGGPGGGQVFSRTALPATMNIDGKDRPTTNSNGQPIHPTEEGVRNFYRWFADSRVVDEQGRPLVVYHGTDANEFSTFSTPAFFTEDLELAQDRAKLRQRGPDRVMEVFLRITDDDIANGSSIEKWQDAQQFIVKDPTQIKSATGNTGAFSPTDPDIRFSRAADMAGNAIDKAKQTADKAMGKDFPRAASMPDLSDDQRSLLGKVGASQSPASDAIKAATDRAGLKIRQGMVDRFAALKELDEKALGQNFIADSITNSAWVLAKMSSAGAGALNAMMKSGRIEMDANQKVIGLKGAPNGGLTASLQKLGGPAEVERFFAWVAANRSHAIIERNKEAIAKTAEAKRELKNIIEMQAIPGKTAQQVSQLSDARKEWEKIIAKHEPFLDVTERLFTEDEVAAGRTLNTGTTEGGKVRPALYSQVHAEFQQYRDDVLAIAEQAGIINGENRAMWRDEFYVPFYRVMEDDADRGRSGGNGLSRQEAYKKLKGGKQNLNDLMENTLMNFHHLLSASLKNQAAVQAIKNAETVGIARKVPEARRDTKTSTFVLVDGKKVFYEVDDPLVFESITTLADPGLNNTAVRVMGAFKRLFTNMTTATPQFIIANAFRDLLQASATSPTSKNIAKNLKEGIQSYRDEKTRAEMLASGGAFSFGHIYGMGADEVKASLQKTVAGAGLISSPSMIPSILRKGWDAWGNVTDLSENASRAATYAQNVDQMGKLRAAFEARDVMDFSQHGAWPAVRLLVRIVPFLNARLQGLDKLYRSGLKPSILTAMGKGTDTDKQAAARFSMVTGALTLATMALYLVNADDDEYKKLEEWQKDTYWFIRIGENAFFLPKPFEVGAIATIAERTLQQSMDDKATGKLFRERMWEMLMQTFAFNPTPQMFQPLIDVYSNKDAFTGRDIESAGMERMSAGLRSRDSTTAPATAISAISRVFGDESAIAVSPVQADHLIKGYLGGVGATAAGWIDTMYRAATGQSSPDKAWSEYQPIRRFYRDLDVPVANTRYTTLFYDGLKEANRVYADVMELQKLGRPEDATTLAAEKRNVLQMRIALNAQQRRMTEINNRMKEVRRSDRDGEWKRREIDLLNTQKALITERMGKRIEDARVQ